MPPNSRNAPMTKLMPPLTPNMPKPSACISTASKTAPKAMRAAPTQFTGRLPRATRPSARAMTPRMPGPHSPGSRYSTKMPITPRVSNVKAMLGSAMKFRKRSTRVGSISLISSPAV